MKNQKTTSYYSRIKIEKFCADLAYKRTYLFLKFEHLINTILTMHKAGAIYTQNLITKT